MGLTFVHSHHQQEYIFSGAKHGVGLRGAEGFKEHGKGGRHARAPGGQRPSWAWGSQVYLPLPQDWRGGGKLGCGRDLLGAPKSFAISNIQHLPFKEPFPSDTCQEGSSSSSLFPFPLFSYPKPRPCSWDSAQSKPLPFENWTTWHKAPWHIDVFIIVQAHQYEKPCWPFFPVVLGTEWRRLHFPTAGAWGIFLSLITYPRNAF